MAQDWHGVQQGNPQGGIQAKITNLGIEYSLVTQFTSFVAVEDKVVNEGGETMRVEVPVEMPDGVSYEGVFGPQSEMLVGGVASNKALGRTSVAQSLALAAPVAPLPVESEALLFRGGERPPAIAADAPARLEDREEAVFEMPKDESDRDDALQKLDPALQGLAAKLVNGAYEDGTVKVVHGRVQVFIYLDALTAANVEQLRKLGVQVLSQAASKQAVMASVAVSDLETIAKLGFVTKVTPPQF
jgi:Ca-activated chloride channel family protein